MFTIKKVPSLVSNYREEIDSEESEVRSGGGGGGGGCGRNCVGRCCLPGKTFFLS